MSKVTNTLTFAGSTTSSNIGIVFLVIPPGLFLK
jgi:hypothetical protein